MEKILIFAFCAKSGCKLLLFWEKTLKNCETVLELERQHNLKHKNIILPSDYIDGGYHRDQIIYGAYEKILYMWTCQEKKQDLQLLKQISSSSNSEIND